MQPKDLIVTIKFDPRPWCVSMGRITRAFRELLGDPDAVERGMTGDTLAADEGRYVADQYAWSL
jgi:hypothetical protein